MGHAYSHEEAERLHAVIMAGGSGTRFWPKSRQRRPKQLIRIVGDQTMIQQTVGRLRSRLPSKAFLIVTNADQIDEMRRQLPELEDDQFVAEPCGRDTAACIGLAAFILSRNDPGAVMGVFAADHVISPTEELNRCIEQAAAIAETHHCLVTFGIPPSGPSPLYGYIRRGDAVSNPGGDLKAFRIAEFTEKPSPEQAESYLRTGAYYWNSGNFVWRVADILTAIRQYLPELYSGLDRISSALGTPDEASVMAREYPELPRTSIDYGVMEKAPNTVVLEAAFDWDDVGSWEAIARHHSTDEYENVSLARHVAKDTSNCIVVSEDEHVVATLGVRDLVIVSTPDATLVCDRNRAPEVKALVDLMRDKGLGKYL